MSKSASFTGLLAAIYLAVAGQAALAAVEVKLTVQETSQAARQPGMVTTGVPFAKGAVKDIASLSVSAAEQGAAGSIREAQHRGTTARSAGR